MSDSSVTRIARLVWSPADTRQVAAEARLHQLADQIAEPWPSDPFDAQLAEWPAAIVCPVVIP